MILKCVFQCFIFNKNIDTTPRKYNLSHVHSFLFLMIFYGAPKVNTMGSWELRVNYNPIRFSCHCMSVISNGMYA